MGTHAHANGKSRAIGTNGTALDGSATDRFLRSFVGGIDEVKAKLDRVAQLEEETRAKGEALAAAREANARISEEKAKLEAENTHRKAVEDARSKSFVDANTREMKKRGKTRETLIVTALKQKAAWASGSIDGVEAIISFAGVTSEAEVGAAAIELLKQIKRMRKRCKASIAGHAFDVSERSA